ncbi:MAG: CapA family protein [Candidatus Dadabacteria bacterium]|nr:CapA family protein [Candidatus Dadabacteria bacterium]
MKLGFMGDVMIGRLVNEQISLKGDYVYPWGDVLPLILQTDINIINLEATLTTSGKKVPKVFNFKANPEKVRTLSAARIDVCNLANNHIMDFSKEGLIETARVLEEAGIKHVGAGRNISRAREAAVQERGGVTVGVISCTDNEPDWCATEDRPGTNYIKVGDTGTARKLIEETRDEVDVLILSVHWGPNMRLRPTRQFIDFAHRVIDCGVDIIHGHSAHVFQGIEIYKDKLILYDTGDFIDDYRVEPVLRNDRSFMVVVELDKTKIVKTTLYPVLISRMQVNLSTGSEFTESVEGIKKLCSEFNTTVMEIDKTCVELEF